MNWTQRLDRITRTRNVDHADIVAAFSKATNLMTEFGVPVDEYGQALDALAQAHNDKFGWSLLAEDFVGAVVAFEAFVERAAMLRVELAA